MFPKISPVLHLCHTLCIVTLEILPSRDGVDSLTPWTRAGLVTYFAAEMTVGRSKLKPKKSCTILLTPGTPHLLWGQASGRQRQHGAKLNYPGWYHPGVANLSNLPTKYKCINESSQYKPNLVPIRGTAQMTHRSMRNKKWLLLCFGLVCYVTVLTDTHLMSWFLYSASSLYHWWMIQWETCSPIFDPWYCYRIWHLFSD